MEVVDLQVHEPGIALNWDDATPEVRRAVLTETLLQLTDAVGVDAVALHPMFDVGWALDLAHQAPRRWGVVPVLLGGGPHPYDVLPLEEDGVREAAATPGVVGLRLLAGSPSFPAELARLEAGGYDRALAICQDAGLPVLGYFPGRPAVLGALARRFPDVQFVLDHLGLAQHPLERAADPSAAAEDVLALAVLPNVAVKASHPIALSAQPWPFDDAWVLFERYLEAFGPERLAWGSDIGRFRVGFGFAGGRSPDAYPGRHTYAESVAFFRWPGRLSAAEQVQVLGATARRVLRWP